MQRPPQNRQTADAKRQGGRQVKASSAQEKLWQETAMQGEKTAQEREPGREDEKKCRARELEPAQEQQKEKRTAAR